VLAVEAIRRCPSPSAWSERHGAGWLLLLQLVTPFSMLYVSTLVPSFTEEPLAGSVLFHGLATFPPGACRRTTWHLAESGGASPGHGYALEARLQERQRVVGVQLVHPGSSIRRVPLPEVAVSEDGRDWHPVAAVRRISEWAWAGRTLLPFFGEVEELLLPPTPGRHLRVRLALPGTTSPAGRPVTGFCVRGERL
jgi:hypothetical protein